MTNLNSDQEKKKCCEKCYIERTENTTLCSDLFCPCHQQEKCECGHQGNLHQQVEGKCAICINCPFIHFLTPPSEDWIAQFNELCTGKSGNMTWAIENSKLVAFIASKKRSWAKEERAKIRQIVEFERVHFWGTEELEKLTKANNKVVDNILSSLDSQE